VGWFGKHAHLVFKSSFSPQEMDYEDDEDDVREAIRLSLLDCQLREQNNASVLQTEVNEVEPSKEKRSHSGDEEFATESAIESATPTEVEMMRCPICMEVTEFAAVGDQCDHMTCSLCYVRLHLLVRDVACPICKRFSEHHVISRLSRSGPASFQSHGLWVGRSAHGVIYDDSLHAHFVLCGSHHATLSALTAVHCSMCKERFRDVAHLRVHLRKAHRRVLCSLCVEHRPVFIGEQHLYTDAELRRHNDGNLTFSDVGQMNRGHPRCLFCHESYFDAAHLQDHMIQKHYICFFCPSQQRYFQNYESLEQHVATEHYMCALCRAQQRSAAHRGAMPGFSSEHEYHQHMLEEHGSQGSSSLSVMSGHLSMVPYGAPGQSSTSRIERSLGLVPRAPSEADLSDAELFPSLDGTAGGNTVLPNPNPNPNPNPARDNNAPSLSGLSPSNSSTSLSTHTLAGGPWDKRDEQRSVTAPPIVAPEVDPRELLPSLTTATTTTTTTTTTAAAARGGTSEVTELVAANPIQTAHKESSKGAGDLRRSRARGSDLEGIASSVAAIGKSVSPTPARRPIAAVEGRRDYVAHLLGATEGIMEWTGPSPALEIARSRANRVLSCLRCCEAQTTSKGSCLVKGGVRGDDVLFAPCYSAELVEWALGSVERELSLRDVERRLLSFTLEASRRTAELKPMPNDVRKAMHQLAFYCMVGSRSYGDDGKRHVLLSKRLGSHVITSVPALSALLKVAISARGTGDASTAIARPSLRANQASRPSLVPRSAMPTDIAVIVSNFPRDFCVAHVLEVVVDELETAFTPTRVVPTGLSLYLTFASSEEAWACAEVLEQPLLVRAKAGLMSPTTAPAAAWQLHVACLGFDVVPHRLASRTFLQSKLAALLCTTPPAGASDREKASVPTAARNWWPAWSEDMWSAEALALGELEKERLAVERARIGASVRLLSDKRETELREARMKLRDVKNAFDGFLQG